MKFTLTVDSKQANTYLMGYPTKLRDRILTAVKRLAIELQGYVKQNKLSGQVLHTVTGTLRRSINQEVNETPTSIIATVGTNVNYAHVQEYGFKGDVSVGAYVRTMKSGKWNIKGEGDGGVAGYTMTINMPERSFLRSALEDFQTKIIDQLTEAAHEAK